MKVVQGSIPFVRLNHIKGIESIMKELEERGIFAVHLDSSQKGKREVFNVMSECYETEHVNPVYGGIVDQSKLPSEIKGKLIQVYLVTSFVEVGTNICAVGEYQDPNLYPIFVCNDVKNTNTSSIIQFLNRVRYQVDACAVFITKKSRLDVPYCNPPHYHRYQQQ